MDHSKLLCYKVVNVYDFRTISPQLIRTVKLPRHKQVKLNVLIFFSFSPSSPWLFFISFIHTRKFCFCYSFHWVAISIISFYYCRIFALPDKIPLLVLFFYHFFKLVLSLCFYILFQMLFNNSPCAKIRQYKIDLIRIRVWIEWCTRTAEC